jgi:hypothetical protein
MSENRCFPSQDFLSSNEGESDSLGRASSFNQRELDKHIAAPKQA